MADPKTGALPNSRLQVSSAGVLNFRPILSGIDNQRILAVLEKAVERLELLRVMNYETATDAVTIGALSAATAISAAASAADGAAAGASSLASSSSPNANNSAAIAEALLKQTKGATANAGRRGVGDILDEQRALEEHYEALLKASQRDGHNPREPTLDAECYAHVKDEERDAIKAELKRVSNQLKEQSRLLCRQLRENPNDSNNWKKVVTERDELIKLLLAAITELQTSAQASADAAVHTRSSSASGGQGVTASYESLARKVLDEQSASAWADALVKKEKETNQSVKQLQNDVKLERALKEQELEQCDRQLGELKTQLRELKKAMQQRADKLRAETEAATEAQEVEALEQQRVLGNAIGSTLGAIDVEQTVHAEMQSHVAKKKALLEEYIQRRNAAMNEKNESRDRMRSDLQNDCNARKADIDRKEAQKEEGLEAKTIREREAAERARQIRDMEARNNARYEATTKLQAALKGMITRANLVTLKKKFAKKKNKPAEPTAAAQQAETGTVKVPGKK